MALLVSPAGSLPLVYALEPAPDAWLAFQSLADLRGALFLDSAAPDRFRGRHSYVTAAPFEMIRGGLDGVQVDAFVGTELADGGAPQRSTLTGDPFQIVQERLARFAAEPSAVAPPFQGGAAGLFGYGLSRVVEKLPPPERDEFGLPDLVLGLYDWVLAFDPSERRAFLVSQGFPAATEAERRLRASSRAEEVLMRLAAGEKAAAPALEGAPLAVGDLAPSHAVPGNSGLLSNFTPAGYVNAVRRAIEYVHAGDIFQVNISQRLLLPLGASPLEVYGRLRRGNPAPYAGYFHTGEVVIASCSPEQFLTLSGREVVTRPIKGTRPRGYTPEADSYGREALFESEKDRAENVMIVDLLRNDLSRVAKPGTVTVPRLFEIEGYPTVHHLVSEVRGELRDGLRAMDLLRAAFPGGSVTGAPKVRAMEIIQELEPTARGPYCGSLGWISFHGDLGLNILIRTVTIARGWLQFPVGGGVVALSNPDVEYQETLHKANGILRALMD